MKSIHALLTSISLLSLLLTGCGSNSNDHGTTPIISKDGKTITYGLYPQSKVTDTELVKELNAIEATQEVQSNGYFIYKDNYYKKAQDKYWFKCEPISWKILSSNNDEYFVISADILDVHQYHPNHTYREIDNKEIYSQNYIYSDIRAWLNGYDGSSYNVYNYSSNSYGSFYKSAFSLGDDYIVPTTIDTSFEEETSSVEDKIFLLSTKDLNNGAYGFYGPSNRHAQVSEYAKIRGAYTATEEGYVDNGIYWTRSPFKGDNYSVWRVGYAGNLNSKDVTTSDYGVRAALTIKIPQ